MPRENETGPAGQGSGTDKGLGQTSDGGNRSCGRSIGPVGICICPQCGSRTPHQRGIPCKKLKCAKCGSTLIRE